MTQVDTNASLAIFPAVISTGLIVACAVLAGFFLFVVPFAWADQQWVIVGMCLGMGGLFAFFFVLLLRARGRAEPAASLTLSPEGLHLFSGTKGVVPWREVQSLGSISVKGNAALIVTIEDAAWGRLSQTKLFEKARKYDKALGVNGITFFQQQLELPIPVVADLLHQYSVAHGGPALLPDP